MNPDKPRFPAALATQVADELCAALTPSCHRIIVAGSLRRKKPTVGDIEILYIPKTEWGRDPGDFFSSGQINLADKIISDLVIKGVLEKRKNVNGSTMFGPKNKLMLHRATGLPVDLFSAGEENWWNYLVCRTGPAESNTRICMAAQTRGWKWNPYGSGFSRLGEVAPMSSEEEVFAFVGLPYKNPEDRV